MLRNFFRLYMMNKLFGGRRMRGRRGLGCGCIGIIIAFILIFLLLRGCGAIFDEGSGYSY